MLRLGVTQEWVSEGELPKRANTIGDGGGPTMCWQRPHMEIFSLVSSLQPYPSSWSLPLYSPPLRLLSRPMLSLHESKGLMTPRKSRLCGTMVLPSPWLYYLLPCICIPFFAIGRSTSAVL
ncbi:hypothetical protein BHE74_00015169 [Ensete ventricosum]|nr:hypothetical protein BHE74_00015169 [Ensete ventricosum]